MLWRQWFRRLEIRTKYITCHKQRKKLVISQISVFKKIHLQHLHANYSEPYESAGKKKKKNLYQYFRSRKHSLVFWKSHGFFLWECVHKILKTFKLLKTFLNTLFECLCVTVNPKHKTLSSLSLIFTSRINKLVQLLVLLCSLKFIQTD